VGFAIAAALFEFCEQSSLTVLSGGEPPVRPREISNRAIPAAMQRDLGLEGDIDRSLSI